MAQPDTAAWVDDTQLSTTQCAAYAKKHRRTIVSWIQSGHLPAYRDPGTKGHYRVRFADLKKVLSRPALPEAPVAQED